MRLAALAAALVLAGCESYEKDLRVICDAPKVVDGSGDPAEVAMRLAQHVQQNVRSQKAMDFLESLGDPSLDPDQKREKLVTEAAKHGISPCAMAELQASAVEPVPEEGAGPSYADDLRAICAAPDLKSISKVTLLTAEGGSLVRTLGMVPNDAARADLLSKEAQAHSLACPVVSK